MRRHFLRFARQAAAACVPTADNVKGPAYRKGAPFRDRLCAVDEPGEPLIVSGTVTSAAGCTPLAGALLDVWQTDARGLYSNLLGLADPAKPGAFRLRGRLRSDEQGRYRFVSVLPGHYPLWILTRPRHVHFVVSCSGHRTLVTQLYFAGDPRLSRDPWVESSLVMAPREETLDDGRRSWRVVFDLVLEPLDSQLRS
jgi:catechol 1,2-dioxygenase